MFLRTAKFLGIFSIKFNLKANKISYFKNNVQKSHEYFHSQNLLGVSNQLRVVQKTVILQEL